MINSPFIKYIALKKFTFNNMYPYYLSMLLLIMLQCQKKLAFKVEKMILSLLFQSSCMVDIAKYDCEFINYGRTAFFSFPIFQTLVFFFFFK